MSKMQRVGFWVTAGLFCCVGSAHATELTGPHDEQFEGYQITTGNYDVPADTGDSTSATFNDDCVDGLDVDGVNSILTVEGGQFNGNFGFGIGSYNGATLTISGGVFEDGVGVHADSSSFVTIDGGQFEDVGPDLTDLDATIKVYGGQFGPDEYASLQHVNFENAGGTIDIYGAFAGVADGQTVPLTAPGGFTRVSFYGQLQNNSTAQSYSYLGSITLHGTGTLVPEPTNSGLLALLVGSLLVRRKVGTAG